MKTNIYTLYLLLLMTVFMVPQASFAQNERLPYTGTNRVLIAFEGPVTRYDFSSQQMLVRHNKATQRIECIIPITSLVPLHDTIPAAMAYHVLFGAKYPQLLISIHVPLQENFSPNNLLNTTTDFTASVQLQGVNNETRIPVAFNTLDNTLYFSTSFDLMLDNFQASIPAEYLPLLTGRIQVMIDNAKWINLQSR